MCFNASALDVVYKYCIAVSSEPPLTYACCLHLSISFDILFLIMVLIVFSMVLSKNDVILASCQVLGYTQICCSYYFVVFFEFIMVAVPEYTIFLRRPSSSESRL